MRHETGTAGGHLARQLRQRALRQRVGLDQIVSSKTLDRRRINKRAADDTFQQDWVC